MRRQVSVILAALVGLVSADLVSFWQGQADPELQLARCIALKSIEEVGLAEEEMDYLTLILPVDSAWKENKRSCLWWKALMADEDIRVQMLLEAGAATEGAWEVFAESLRGSDGFMESAAGNTFYLGPDDKKICLAEYEMGDYQVTQTCAKFEAPPLKVGDSTYVYKIDKVILPPSVAEELDSISASMSCSDDEVLGC